MNSNFETASAETVTQTIAVTEPSNAPSTPSVESAYPVANQAEVNRLMRDGIAAAKSGNRIEARYLLLEAVRLDERNETAWLWLASISEHPTELYEFLQRVLSINPENARALDWSRSTRALLINGSIQKGAALSKENNRAAAADCFKQATEYDPNNEIAWLWLASVTDELEDKLAYLQRILSINPANEKAAASFHATKRQIARSLLKKGNLAAVSGDHATAREILGDVMEYDNQIEEAWLLKAYLTDSVDEKADCFRRVLDLNPENAQAASGLAALQAMQEEKEAHVAHEEAEVVYEKVPCPFCGNHYPSNLVRCTACKAFVQIDDVEKLLVNDPIDDEPVRNYIDVLHNEQTVRELNAEEIFNLGLAYFNLRNFKKGASYFEQFAEFDSVGENARQQIGEFLAVLKETAPEALNGVASSGKTIMVVDDSPTVRKLIIGKLEKHGHRVVAAVDGMDALSKINEEKPHLILMDVTMPRLDGYQLCKLVKSKAETKHIPVVMISGKDGFFDKVRGRMAGSTAYITKPFGPETLLQTVETYCS